MTSIVIWVVTIILLLLILYQLRKIMTTIAQLATALTAITATVTKIGTETSTLLAKVQELEDAINNGGNVPEEVEAALQALREQVSVVDQLVPDVVEQVGVVTDGEAQGDEAQG